MVEQNIDGNSEAQLMRLIQNTVQKARVLHDWVPLDSKSSIVVKSLIEFLNLPKQSNSQIALLIAEMLFHPDLTSSPFLVQVLDAGSFNAIMQMQVVFDFTISAEAWGRFFTNITTEPWFSKIGLSCTLKFLDCLGSTQQVRKLGAAHLAVVLGVLKLFHIRPQHIQTLMKILKTVFQSEIMDPACLLHSQSLACSVFDFLQFSAKLQSAFGQIYADAFRIHGFYPHICGELMERLQRYEYQRHTLKPLKYSKQPFLDGVWDVKQLTSFKIQTFEPLRGHKIHGRFLGDDYRREFQGWIVPRHQGHCWKDIRSDSHETGGHYMIGTVSWRAMSPKSKSREMEVQTTTIDAMVDRTFNSISGSWNYSDVEDRSHRTNEIPLIGAKIERVRQFKILNERIPQRKNSKLFDDVGGVWDRGSNFAVSYNSCNTLSEFPCILKIHILLQEIKLFLHY